MVEHIERPWLLIQCLFHRLFPSMLVIQHAKTGTHREFVPHNDAPSDPKLSLTIQQRG